MSNLTKRNVAESLGTVGVIEDEDIVFLDSYLNNAFFIEQWPIIQGLVSIEFREYLEKKHLGL